MIFAKKILQNINLVSIVFYISACSSMHPMVSNSTHKVTILPSASALPPILPVGTSQKGTILDMCPSMLLSNRLTDIETGGTVVLLKGKYPDDVRDAYLINLEDQQLSKFSQEGEILSYYRIAVSPDRNTLAYSVITPKDEAIKLVLSNNMGERQKTTVIKSDIPYPMYGSIGGWLTDQWLLLDHQLLDPYTGEKLSFSPEDFQGISPDDFGVYSLDFDSKLTRVVYAHSHGTLALADLETNQVLVELPTRSKGAPKVAWSPDNSIVAVVGSQVYENNVADEIFFVDHDGEIVRQVTHLSEYYDGSGYGLANLSWSPDGAYIAFWQNFDSSISTGLRLFVLNAKTEEITSYCVWGKPKGVVLYGPIWSPDGAQLLIGDFGVENEINTIVVDLAMNIAISVGRGYIPVGWMRTP